MKARVAHLTGSRAGTETIVWKRYATIGRAAQADVRLAPDTDLMVAARHAALVWHDGAWAIRDLESTNGTYVDGSRVHGETVLRDGAVVQLGRGGPTFRFSVIREAGAPEPVHTSDIVASGDPDALRVVPRTPVILAGGRELADAAPAAARRARARWPAVAAVAGVLVTAGWLSLARARPDHDPRAMRDALVARADRAYDALDALPGTAPLLAGPAREAQAQVARLRSRARRAPADPAALAALGDSLAAAEAVAARLALAATLDVRALLHDGAGAIALVTAELEDGGRVSSPAVAVRRADGRTVYVALRQGLVDDIGRLPRRLRVHVAGGGSSVATVARSSTAAGVLLLVPATDAGARPVALARVAHPAPGQPAFLLGLDARGDTLARPATAALATVAREAPGELRLDALGDDVPPGSLVLDGAGGLLGVVVPAEGAAPAAVRAVPAADLLRLMEDRSAG